MLNSVCWKESMRCFLLIKCAVETFLDRLSKSEKAGLISLSWMEEIRASNRLCLKRKRGMQELKYWTLALDIA